jgi:hypothetical protein
MGVGDITSCDTVREQSKRRCLQLLWWGTVVKKKKWNRWGRGWVFILVEFKDQHMFQKFPYMSFPIIVSSINVTSLLLLARLFHWFDER